MVIALLLSDPNKPLRYTDLSRVALQCLYGAHLMWKALTVLQSALPCETVERTSSTRCTQPSRPLSVFDAHVGDSSCQTRTQMLWELAQSYNTPEKKDALDCAIAMLQELRMQAALLVQEIERNHGKPRLPTLDAFRSHLSIWQHIGFTRFLDLFYEPSDLPPETRACTTLPSESSHKRYQLTAEPKWDTNNLFLVARFLTLCLLLSESKVAKMKSGPPIRVIVRVDLQLMYADIRRELETLGLVPVQKATNSNNSKLKLNGQCDAMQGYVSIVTTDWVRKAALKLGLRDFHQSLGEGLIVTNCRRISCVATYASTLLVRASWLVLDTPLLVAIQKFCSHGEFHNIYYRITRNSTFSPPSFCEMGESSWFDVTLVSDEDIVASPWSTLPHVIMICMSGEGTIDDFRGLLLDRNQGNMRPNQPHKGTCEEVLDYVNKLKGLNFARFISQSSVHHDQFPFTLADNEDAFRRVFDLIQKGLDERASDAFRTAKDGADDFGAGRSMSLFTIEHFIMEYPAVIFKELQGKPIVYGCKFES